MSNKNEKLVIENTSKAVQVFKALGVKPLRIFPGFNYIDKNVDYKAYFKGNKAAQSMAKEHLREVNPEILDSKDKRIAKDAQTKNDDMNKSYRIITENKKAIAGKDKDLAAQAAMIDRQDTEIVEQGIKLANQATTLKEMKEQMKKMAESLKKKDK